MAYLVSRISQMHKVLLMIMDLICFLISASLVFALRLGSFSAEFFFDPFFWITSLIILSSLYIFGAYDFTGGLKARALGSRIFRALILCLILIGFLTFSFAQEAHGFFGRGILAGTLFLFFILSSGPRLMFFQFEKNYHRSLEWLFLGSQEAQFLIQKDLKKNKFQGHATFMTPSEMDSKKMRETAWHGIVLALEEHQLNSQLAADLMEERLSGQPIMDICAFYEKNWSKIPVDFVNKSWVIMTQGFALVENPIQTRVKRLMDLTMAVLLLLVVWPFMLLTAVAVRLETEGKALFKQMRVGKNGKEFVIYKFRSMVSDAEKNGAQWASKNDSRVTKVGKFIRASRLDELPQLFNVIRGDMSFVGPRPERAELNAKIEQVVPFYNIRHMVRPGLTGWAQVLFPYGASIEDSKEKLQFEIYYIKNYSLTLDIMILLKTISVVLLGRGR